MQKDTTPRRDAGQEKGMRAFHVPAMVREVLDVLSPKPGGRFIDATLGDGGHTEAILEASDPDGSVLGIERDPEMFRRAEERLAVFQKRAVLVNANYVDIRRLAEQRGFTEADGILFDLGVASWHFDGARRGFSFRSEEPLDMRFNPDEDRPGAAELLNHSSQEEIEKILRELGEEPEARKIARAVVRRRPITTTRMLTDIISQTKSRNPAPSGAGRRTRIHPATRVFQALRIAVNDELGSVASALPEAVQTLRLGGILAVIAYHSLEDRIIKQFMRERARRGTLTLVFSSPLVPSREEVASNPRVRSAKLRAARRI